MRSSDMKRFALRALLVTSAVTIGIGIQQGFQLRDRFIKSKPLESTNEPQSGTVAGRSVTMIDKIVEKGKNIKDKTTETITKSKEALSEWKRLMKIEKDEAMKRFKEKWRRSRHASEIIIKTGVNKDSMLQSTPGVYRLLIIGDSLVSGVGMYESNSHEEKPIFATTIARSLSVALNSKMEWYSVGKVGATVNELDPLLDKFFQSLEDSDHDQGDREQDGELIVILVCGLNDWKDAFINFPRGFGLLGFRNNLQQIIAKIQSKSSEHRLRATVYLPALPIKIGFLDENFGPKIKPLGYIFEFVCYLWDNQKQILASECKDKNVVFIEEPTAKSEYFDAAVKVNTTGNFISDDGVHPSRRGYFYYAMHLSDRIINSRR